MHFHAWRRGLKTGMYYLRTQPATEAIKFTLGRGAKRGAAGGGAGEAAVGGEAAAAGGPPPKSAEQAAAECALNSAPGECEMCGS